jgi:hypothetical protein
MIVKSNLAYILLPLNDSVATIGSAIGASAAKLGSGLGANAETSGLPPANGKPANSLGQLLVDMLQQQEGAGNSSSSRQVNT